jgi:hypothetical protein
MAHYINYLMANNHQRNFSTLYQMNIIKTSSPALSDKDVNKLQQLTGTLLYYARAVDPALIMPINVLASEKSKATEVTANKVIKLLKYCNTHPETKIRYHSSDMILHIHSDALYLSENEAQIRAGELFYMGSGTKTNKKLTNGGNFDHQQSSQTHHVFGSGSRNWCSLKKCKRRSSPSYNIGRARAPPPPTPMETDNTTATGYSNGTIEQKRTKAMDMRFYLIKDRVKQGQFYVYWGPGYHNLADYFTEYHSLAHHKIMREIYIHTDKQPLNWKGIRDSALRGCVNNSGKAGAQIPHFPLGDDSSTRGR